MVKKAFVTLLDGAKESSKIRKKNTLFSQLKTIFGSSITVSVNSGFPIALKRIGAADDVDKMPSSEDQK